MIIAIEGIDGAGKNTLVKRLRNAFDADTLSFPRYQDSIHAQLAQRALHHDLGDVADSINAMAVLFALDRAEVKDYIASYAYDPRRVLILDRYVASNAAYSAARSLDDALVEWVATFEFIEQGLPVPDLQILLATSPELAHERAHHRARTDTDRAIDSYEADRGLQNRTAATYRRLAQENWYSPWLIIDGQYNHAEVEAQVREKLPACTNLTEYMRPQTQPRD
ncbi:dTMP kinase [Corynebacterium sp. ES2730-CONJ]|uniref:dTMP kinase n=1 Tax=Corynebacterium sp. ES2730-CONJ TaxID=2973941 RepID=UPI00216B00E0|nr:dTMP kinase [Corynebacterium sp. ES2730-CONJ]MCS4531397.1 dTMP kinase [Corynebacterium sp. ES2730-CONJ]